MLRTGVVVRSLNLIDRNRRMGLTELIRFFMLNAFVFKVSIKLCYNFHLFGRKAYGRKFQETAYELPIIMRI